MPEATMDADQGREQAVPAHPALTAFVHPCTADAEASLAMTGLRFIRHFSIDALRKLSTSYDSGT